jgi:hypothetical protein
LADEEDDNGNEDGEKCCCHDRNDLVPHGVREIGVDDLAILEGD